jgi:dihydroflavonol-4-reductase
MKAFITGGTGFIGSHLVDDLLYKSELNVSCLIRNDLKWLGGKNIDVVKGDLFDLKAIKQGLDGCNVVYHCAGVVKAPNHQAFLRGNVESTENVLRMAIKMKVPKVVILSSLAAVGPSNGRPLTEADPLNPVTLYGQSKKAMEEMVTRVAEEAGQTSITIVRPPAVYGPREQDILTIFKMAARGLFPMVGDGSSTRLSVVHVKDLVRGMELAARQHPAGLTTYFISGEPPITWNDFRMATARALGRKVRAFKIRPTWVPKIASIVEKSAGLLGNYPALNREKAKEMVLEWMCSTHKAHEELGYNPKVSLDEGIFDTVQWYKAHHWI